MYVCVCVLVPTSIQLEVREEVDSYLFGSPPLPLSRDV